MTAKFRWMTSRFKKIIGFMTPSQKTCKKHNQKPHKNPQENQKVISFRIRTNIKINVDIAMRKGVIHSLGQLSNTIYFLNEIAKV
jgi:hypothetical protein